MTLTTDHESGSIFFSSRCQYIVVEDGKHLLENYIMHQALYLLTYSPRDCPSDRRSTSLSLLRTREVEDKPLSQLSLCPSLSPVSRSVRPQSILPHIKVNV